MGTGAGGREAKQQQSVEVSGHSGERRGSSSQSQWAGTRERGGAAPVSRGEQVLGGEAGRAVEVTRRGHSGGEVAAVTQ